MSFTFSTDQFPQALSNNIQAANIFHECAKKTGPGLGKHDVAFVHNVQISLGLGLSDGRFKFGAPSFWNDHITHHVVPVTVRCKAHKKTPVVVGGKFKNDQGKFKVKDIKLSLSTFSGANSQPNPATTCKKGHIQVNLTATKAGATQFKLWTKKGGAPVTSKVIQAWAFHDGNGGFKAQHSEWISVDKTTIVQAKAEETISTIGKYDGWKSITLSCKGAGGHGGFKPDSNSGNPNQPEAPPLNIKGEFSYIDHGSPKCSRTGKVLISVKTNRADDVHYNLDCTNGQKFSGVAKPTQSPAGGLVAVAVKSFTINKTTNYSCALKTIAPGVTKLHQWKAHKFQCASRLVEPASQNVTHVPPSPAPQPENPNETNPEVPFKLEGELSYVDAQAPKCRRHVKALATVLSSTPGQMPYRLDCSGGPYLEGTMELLPHANGYLGTALRNITISKAKVLRCKLTAKSGQTYRELALERHVAECGSGIARPRVIVNQPRRTTSTPVRPAVKRVQRQTLPRRLPKRTSVPSRPKCTSQWKTECKRTPVRSCRNVVATACQSVPKVSCTSSPKRTCSRVPKRTCRTVRGRQVCKTTWTSRCKVTRQRNCKRTVQRKCSRKVTRKCTTNWKKTCTRRKAVICRR